jgi:hypothetical protein
LKIDTMGMKSLNFEIQIRDLTVNTNKRIIDINRQFDYFETINQKLRDLELNKLSMHQFERSQIRASENFATSSSVTLLIA